MKDSKTVMVLGARPGTGNIGDIIAERMGRVDQQYQWSVACHDGYDADFQQYTVPEMDDDVDALVVTLGATMVQPFEEASPSEVAGVIRACLTLPVLAAQRFVKARGDLGGQVVFIGSYAYDHPITYGTAYCAAKAGLAMATRTLAWELAPKGYDFHIIHPYHTPGTPMWEFVQSQVVQNRGMSHEEAEAYAMKDARRGRLLDPATIAECVAFLLNDTGVSEWLSGGGLDLYGGVR